MVEAESVSDGHISRPRTRNLGQCGGPSIKISISRELLDLISSVFTLILMQSLRSAFHAADPISVVPLSIVF